MKKILTIALLAMAASTAFADSTDSHVKTDSKAISKSQGGAGGTVGDTTASSAGNTSATGNVSNTIEASVIPTDTTVHQDVSGTQTIRNTPSVSGPNLVSSNDTCMGAASGSINAPGIGLSLGKTYTDSNCVMLKNSRELWNMGMKGAAIALMCTDLANKEALELTGTECPQTTRARNNVALQQSVQPTQAQYTDPIVRARLGLAPLVASK